MSQKEDPFISLHLLKQKLEGTKKDLDNLKKDMDEFRIYVDKLYEKSKNVNTK
jgi:hypothetical protein